jgi:uncharacterized protein (DUF4415 family)
MKKQNTMRGDKTQQLSGGTFDLAKIDAATEEDIERHAREDGEEEWTPDMIRRAHMFRPGKRDIHIRLDPDVLDFFQRQGRGYQSRINAALRAYVDAHTRRAS